jgi:hypothetical protein
VNLPARLEKQYQKFMQKLWLRHRNHAEFSFALHQIQQAIEPPEQSEYSSSHQLRYVGVQGLQANRKGAGPIPGGGMQCLNHSQWNRLNNFLGAPNFLYPTGAHMPRVLQFAIRITF